MANNTFGKVVRRLRNTYRKNSNTKLGEYCFCPSCGNRFKKTDPDQKFCKKNGDMCREYYWELVRNEGNVTMDNKTKIP